MTNLTLGILAHVDAGKTTLSEALLFQCGTIRRAGRVDHGDAFLDTDAMEKKRGITIFSKQALLEAGDLRIQLLDTPGHSDFSAETERVLQVLDAAILVISAVDGIQSHTRTIWNLLDTYHVPTIIFINKIDQAGANADAVVSQLREEFGSMLVDFSPLYPEDDPTNPGTKPSAEAGSASSGSGTKHSTEAGSASSGSVSKLSKGTSPDFSGSGSDAAREQWAEEIALCDETLLAHYLEHGTIPENAIQTLTGSRRLIPILRGSALRHQGIDSLIDALQRFTETPAYPDEFGARVYKISRDESGTRLTHLKVTGGTLHVRDALSGTGRDGSPWNEKVNAIRIYNGARFEEVPFAEAGTICAVTGLSAASQSDGLGFEPPGETPLLNPVLSYRILPPDDVDPARLYEQLRDLEDEEPELRLLWNEETREIQAGIMGEVQTEILSSRIQERYGIDVRFTDGSILYKETVASPVEGVGHYEPLRHYAEVHLILTPGAPGSGITVSSICSEDDFALNWQRLVFTHLTEREFRGVLTGSPLTDVHIMLAAGRASAKHTEGGDFRQATYRAIRQGLMEGESVLLEPMYAFRLELPQGYAGRAMTDLDSMHAVDTVLQQTEDTAILTGTCPVSTMQNYSARVRAYSRGTGILSLSVCGYAPCHNAEEVIAAQDYDPDADTREPSWSVFCTHGAGISIPWFEVKQYMHLPPVLRTGSKGELDPSTRTAPDAPVVSGTISPDEVDRIMERTFYANRRPETRRNPFKKKVVRDSVPTVRTSSTPAAPRDRYLLIDGYNLLFTREELADLAKTSIDSAREQMLESICNYRGMIDDEVIVVFDAYKVKDHPEEFTDYNNIHIVYTATAQTADAYIEKFTHDNRSKYDITVVTSDGLEQIIIRGQGAHLVSSREFLGILDQTGERIASILREQAGPRPSAGATIGEHLQSEKKPQ